MPQIHRIHVQAWAPDALPHKPRQAPQCETQIRTQGRQKSGTQLPAALCRGFRASQEAGPSYHSLCPHPDLRGLVQHRGGAGMN